MQYIIRASLLAVSNSVDLDIGLNCSANYFNAMCYDLLTLFGAEIDFKNQKIHARATVQNDKILRSKVDTFIEKYKPLSVAVYQLRTYMQSLTDNEHIIFHWGSLPDKEQQLPLFALLHSLANGGSPEKFEQTYKSLLTEFLKKYEVFPFHSNKRKRNIGEHDKTKRICRFCQNNRDVTTFKNKAHAISESLGNKSNCLSASVELNLRYARKLSERFPGVSCTVQN